MSNIVISVENLSKSYRLGQIGTGTLSRDLEVWWAKVRGKPNPLLRIDEKDHTNRDGATIWALKDINFYVEQGEALGIIGRNGAGKSTLLKILSRVTAPTCGQIKVKGRIASLLEVGTGFHPELTGRENIYLNGAILGMTKEEVCRKFDEIVDFSGVDKFIDTPVKRYSSGMYVRLAFAVAAHLDPEILVVDEVLAVGDLEFQKKCLGKMGDVANQGRTIFFVSHNMVAIQKLCKRTILLNGGQVSFDGETYEATGNYLKGALISDMAGISLKDRIDRTGSGKIRLTGFKTEDKDGQILQHLQSGEDVVFVFNYECALGITPKNVDIGFSFDTEFRESLFGLYASYVGQTFTNLPPKGSFRCFVRKLAVAPGRYLVGARVTVAGEEADWPQDGIGYVDVIPGDFYGSGHMGFAGRTYLMVNGEWSLVIEKAITIGNPSDGRNDKLAGNMNRGAS